MYSIEILIIIIICTMFSQHQSLFGPVNHMHIKYNGHGSEINEIDVLSLEYVLLTYMHTHIHSKLLKMKL